MYPSSHLIVTPGLFPRASGLRAFPDPAQGKGGRREGRGLGPGTCTMSHRPGTEGNSNSRAIERQSQRWRELARPGPRHHDGLTPGEKTGSGSTCFPFSTNLPCLSLGFQLEAFVPRVTDREPASAVGRSLERKDYEGSVSPTSELPQLFKPHYVLI